MWNNFKIILKSLALFTKCKNFYCDFVKFYYFKERTVKMRAYRISLIRHGQTTANKNGIYIGSRTDYPLSDFGTAELYNKMEEFEYPRVEKVYR